jgi:hypothetical protein
LNINANTGVPYLSKTCAYNLTIPVQVLAKEPCHIPGQIKLANQITNASPLDHIWPSQCIWNPDLKKGKNANTWTQAILPKNKSPNARTWLIQKNQIPTK